jgi:hypothetical protein
MDRRRKYEQQHKVRGLCHLCGRPVVTGKSKCLIHLKRKTVNDKSRTPDNIPNEIRK